MAEHAFSYAKFTGRIGALVCVLVAIAPSASPASPAPHGRSRAWALTEIRSLDPIGLADATSDATRHSDQVLSNETTFTRWAYVDQIVSVYQAPSVTSARIGRLTWYTADGFSSIYLLLRSHWDVRGQEWVKLRIPGRPNGRTGWVERAALGPFHLTHLLVVVNRAQRRMYFFRDGRQIWSAPVAVGKPSTPTPAGHFWVDERFQITDPSSGYYPYAFGTTDYSTLTEWPGGGVVGIHGPYYDPQGIPGDISHGCIRLSVADDRWLAAHLKLGTPLHVV